MALRKEIFEQRNLTQEFAAKFDAMTPLPGERRRKERRLRFLLDKLRQGHFYSPHWAMGVELQTGQRYRLDGQHTSYLLTHLPQDVQFPVGLSVMLETVEFDSVVEDALDLFDKYNPPESARTNDDVMGLYQSQYPEFKEFNPGFLLNVAAGLNRHEAGLQDGRALPARQRGMLWANPSYREFALWAGQFQGPKDVTLNFRFLRKPIIVAEMFADMCAHREAAGEFWGHVFRADVANPHDETRQLADELNKLSERKNPTAERYRAQVRKFRRRWMMKHLEDRSVTGSGPTAPGSELATGPELMSDSLT